MYNGVSPRSLDFESKSFFLLLHDAGSTWDIKPGFGLPLEKLKPSIVPLLTVSTVGTRGTIIPAILDYPLWRFFVFVPLASRGERELRAGVDIKYKRPKMPSGCAVEPGSSRDIKTAGQIVLCTEVIIRIFKPRKWTNTKNQQFRSPSQIKRPFTMSRNSLRPPSSLPYPLILLNSRANYPRHQLIISSIDLASWNLCSSSHWLLSSLRYRPTSTFRPLVTFQK